MPVQLSAPVPAQLYPIAGVRLGVTEAGIRKAKRKDLSLVLLDPGTSVAGVFTQNRFVRRRCKFAESIWPAQTGYGRC